MRWLWRILVGLLILAPAVPLGGYLWLRQSLPAYDGSMVSPGLEAPVRIVRDAHAIPHIEARTLRDAYFALGVVHAQDRLFQMEFQRRAASGRLSELLGEAALPLDRLVRTLGLRRLAEASLEHFDPAYRDLLEAYAAGVNAYLESRSGPLPPEFLLLRHRPEPWQAADSVAWVKMMALQLSDNWREELVRARLAAHLGPSRLAELWPGDHDGPVTLRDAAAKRAGWLDGLDLDDLAAALPPAPPPGQGSNAWALDGSRTSSGVPILANDPHLGLRAPGTWHLAHLRAPGLNAIGATMPGLPVVVIGRNERIAWGLTTTHSDTQDLFIERVDPDDPGQYLAPAGAEPFAVVEERIGIRGGGEEVLRVRWTRHGPVISDLASAGEVARSFGADRVLALAWPALRDDDRTVEAGMRLMQAGGWDEVVDALRLYVAPQQNVHYADIDGRIGFYAPGLVPIRNGHDGRLPVPGWDGEHGWRGFIPFEELPHALSPPSGALFNANNRIVDDDYPHLIARDWPPSLRARRIEQLLEGGAKDLAAARRMQEDELSLLAHDFLPLFLAAEPESPEAEAAMARLRAWDGVMDAATPEPLIFAAWYEQIRRHVYADELGPLFDELFGPRPEFLMRVLTEDQHWCNNVTTHTVETCGQQIARALDAALGRLRALYGAEMSRWRWGEAHVVRMRHELFRHFPVLGRLAEIRFESGGHGSTLNATHTTSRDPDRPYDSAVGPSLRMVVDLAEPNASRFIAITGQSGNPLSRHYRDYTRLWREGRDLPMSKDPADYAQGALGVLELVPAR